jgi:hypothetical protein
MDELREDFLDKEEQTQTAYSGFLKELGMRRTTDVEERIVGYKTSDRTGEEIESFLEIKPYRIEKRKIDEKIEEILDAADELLENKNDPILLDNLLDSLNSLLDDLWDLRQERERQFAKLIVLLKTITKSKNIDLVNQKQLMALFELIQTFKRPKVVEIDITHCIKVMREAGLDLYRPLRSKPKLKIIIEETS